MSTIQSSVTHQLNVSVIHSSMMAADMFAMATRFILSYASRWLAVVNIDGPENAAPNVKCVTVKGGIRINIILNYYLSMACRPRKLLEN